MPTRSKISRDVRTGLIEKIGGFDTYQLLKPREVATSPVTVVEIDDASLARLGQWPWSRTVLAELVRSISRQRPAAIGIDILMPEPDRLSPDRLLAQARQADPTIADRLPSLPSSDSELARAIAEAPVVLGLAGTPAPTSRQPLAPPFVVVDRVQRNPSRAPAVIDLPHYAGALTNIDLLDRSATGHGLISAGRSDDVIRRIPLASRIADGYVPALPIEMLRVALQASAIRLPSSGGDHCSHIARGALPNMAPPSSFCELPRIDQSFMRPILMRPR